MVFGKKVVVVLPAYNAARTLEKTYREIPEEIVDEVILVDDRSQDDTLQIAKNLPITHVLVHDKNRGYGANQKTCYRKALESGADIVIMVHPDYQYTPKLIHSLVFLIAHGLYPVAMGSRVLGRGALKGGMPLWRYYANRVLTLAQNIIMKQKLSEYHTGYRAYSAEVLKRIDFMNNSDDFVFDNQILAQILFQGHTIAEITCPTTYHDEASSITFWRSVRYGTGVLLTALAYRLQKWKLWRFRMFREVGSQESV